MKIFGELIVAEHHSDFYEGEVEVSFDDDDGRPCEPSKFTITLNRPTTGFLAFLS